MRHWTRRFTLRYSKVGQALNASNAAINKDFLHENIRGILLAETSGLTSSEFASVLATSGTTGTESIGNSWKFAHLVEAFSTQWVMQRWQARKSEAVVATVDKFDSSELSEAAARQIFECEDDGDALLRNVENRQVWYTWHSAKNAELTCRVSSSDVQEASD